MNTVRSYAWIAAVLVLAACAKSVVPESGGSESHFLEACEASSDCVEGLTCRGLVCTRACESDAQCEGLGEGIGCAVDVCDSTDAVVDESLLSIGEVLGEPAEVAFIAGAADDQEIWIAGESRTLRQVSIWPEQAWDSGCPMPEPGFDGGFSRFSQLTFDGTGQYLVFLESESCFAETSEVIVYEVATGRARSLGAFAVSTISAGPRSMLASGYGGDGVSLHEIDPANATTRPITVPGGAGAQVSTQHVVELSGEEIFFGSGVPALRLIGDEPRVFEPMAQLNPDLQLGDPRMSPSGTQLCITARDTTMAPDFEAGLAILVTSQGASIQPTESFDFDCVFSADGRYVMYAGAAFEIEGDALVALPAPSERFMVAGAYGNAFFGTNVEGEIVRFDPEAAASEIILDSTRLDMLCASDGGQSASTWMHMAEDRRGVAVVQRNCEADDRAYSGVLALDLERRSPSEIELVHRPTHIAYDVAWPRGESAWLFSVTELEPPKVYEVSAGEVEIRRLPEVDGIMHSPAVPH